MEIAPAPLASRTEVTSVPLFTIILLNAEGEMPDIVLFDTPLKVTEDEFAVKVPLLVQSPFISRLMVGLKVSVPLIVIF